MSYTNMDLQNAFSNYDRAVRQLDHNIAKLVIEEGSKTNGHAYRLYAQLPNETGYREPPVGPSFLGMSKREAVAELNDRARIVNDCLHIIRRQAGGY